MTKVTDLTPEEICSDYGLGAVFVFNLSSRPYHHVVIEFVVSKIRIETTTYNQPGEILYSAHKLSVRKLSSSIKVYRSTPPNNDEFTGFSYDDSEVEGFVVFKSADELLSYLPIWFVIQFSGELLAILKDILQ